MEPSDLLDTFRVFAYDCLLLHSNLDEARMQSLLDAPLAPKGQVPTKEDIGRAVQSWSSLFRSEISKGHLSADAMMWGERSHVGSVMTVGKMIEVADTMVTWDQWGVSCGDGFNTTTIIFGSLAEAEQYYNDMDDPGREVVLFKVIKTKQTYLRGDMESASLHPPS